MSEVPDRPRSTRDPRRSWQLRTLAAIIFAEAAGVAYLTAVLIVDLFVQPASSLISGLATVAIAAIAAIWLAAIALNALRGRPWIRGATITMQVLQIAVAIGSFQGMFARPDIGFLLLLPALAAIVLLFTPPVVAATTRVEDQ